MDPLPCGPSRLPATSISPAGMRRAVPLAVRAASNSASSAALKVGSVLRSSRRRFTAEDVAAYAAVSRDRNPVHLDDAFARGAGFGRGPVVHGMLAASLFPGLIASRFPGAVYASQTLRFAAPVYAGDGAVAEVKALHIRAAAGRHIVKFATKCFTFTVDGDEERDEETLAIDGEAMVFLPTLHLSPEEAPEYSTGMSVGSRHATKSNPSWP